ncbi:PQQ-binding-like beta-propeller repeat protein [Sphingobacterium sp. Lzh-3]|uniref:beta-alanine-activating enzyme beta-propeller domain-containing protein n=1 Tax=Sphingobacterium sp. Lzh-3 TaxID=3382150 RepID=UPI00398D2360
MFRLKYDWRPIIILFIAVGCFYQLRGQHLALARSLDRQNYAASSNVGLKPSLKWKFQTKGKLFSSPIIWGDVVFVGSCDSNLYALNKTSGDVLWTYKTAGEIRSTVAVDAGIVYFLSADGYLYALDAQTGRKLWQFSTNGEKSYDVWDYFLSSPAVVDGVVYFGSGDHHIYAVGAKSGKLIWKFLTGGIVHAAPTLTREHVFIGSFDGYFYCLKKDGTLDWRFKTIGERYFPKGEIQFNAVVADSTVYFGARDFNVYALNTTNGSGFWVYHQPGSWTSVPSIFDDKLVVTMSDSYSILVLNRIDGMKIAEPKVPLNTFSSATIAGDAAFFGTLDGVIYRLNIKKGEVVPIFQTESSKKNRQLFLNGENMLHADLQQKYKNDITRLFADYLQMGSVFSTLWIEDNRLYFGSADGAIYALE